jgi:hypothetical protein
VQLSDLPFFPEADIPLMITACEEVMLGLGLEQIAMSKNHVHGERVYDLTPDMVFTLSTGERVKLSELEKRAGAAKMKGRADLWDKESRTPDRVLVNKGGAGLALWDTKYGVSHRWKNLAPEDDPEFRKELRALMMDFKPNWEDEK